MPTKPLKLVSPFGEVALPKPTRESLVRSAQSWIQLVQADDLEDLRTIAVLTGVNLEDSFARLAARMGRRLQRALDALGEIE